MAREIDVSRELTDAEVAYLRARYSEQYVNRQIELGKLNAAGPEDPFADLLGDDEDSDEDLIGDGDDGDDEDPAPTSYDPGDKTTREVIEDMKSMSEAEVAAVKAREQDGKGRSSILNA